MSTFKWKGRHWRIFPFLITTATLLFLVFWIGSMAYKYHLETEERRITLNKDITEEAKKLNSALHEENIQLKQEIEHLKSAPYELKRNNGEKEYYNLFTHKLVKKIALDGNTYYYDKNNGLLLKKIDKYNNIYEYGSHGKLIKKTLPDGVWEEYNFVNEKLRKRKNIDGSIEEFDANEEKYKEKDKNGNIKFFKTKLYQTVADFKKLSNFFSISQLREAGFTAKELRDAGYIAKELKESGYTNRQLNILEWGPPYNLKKKIGYTAKDFKDAGYTARELMTDGFTAKELKDAGFTYEVLRFVGFTYQQLEDAGFTY
ncbi:MAG: hypothetical protein WJU30_00310 [Candidatus Phytoplasma pruni]